MKLKLEPYQEEALQFWLDKKRCYWAIDMGLGKTVTALKGIAEIGKPTLVVAPLMTMQSTWPEEIAKWGMDLTYSILHGKNKKEELQKKSDIYLINFEGIGFLYEELLKMDECPFEVLVIDEGTFIKSSSTKRFKYFKALRQLFPEYRLILSGTPAPNSLIDLWSQYFLLTDGEALGKGKTKFLQDFFDQSIYNKFIYTIKAGADELIHEKIKPWTFRVASEDHKSEIKTKYVEHKINLSPPLMKKYKEFLNKDKEFCYEGITYDDINAATLSQKSRQFVQGFLYNEDEFGVRSVQSIHDEKVKQLDDLLEVLNEPVICAIQYKEDVAKLTKKFPYAKTLIGKTSAKEKARLIAQWNEGKIKMLICHPQAISHGVNLQYGGRHLIWYTLTWNLEHYLQLNMRLPRRGQKKVVYIHHLLISGTKDVDVYKALMRKDMTQQKLLEALK